MAFPIRPSHVMALALLGGVAAYMYFGGTVLHSGQGPIDPDAPVRATDTAADDPDLFAVRARDVVARERPNALVMRGRTEADATVSISAETGGRVVEVAVREGDTVSRGDVLCRLDEAARQAAVRQARAAVAQTDIDLSSARSLADDGFTAENRVLALQAAHDAALSVLEQAELDLERTSITAPIDGLVQLPVADVGMQLAPGQLCATLLDIDPLIVTGQVSERDIGALSVGMPATGLLVTGQEVAGEVSYIASNADTATRTFRVDIEVPNSDGTLLSGVTAQASISLPPSRGHLLPLSVLKLADDGAIGVSLVDEANRIVFQPVTLMGDEGAGVWVSGLPDEARIVVVGQDYVEVGQEVAVTMVEDGPLQTSQAPAADDEPEEAAQ